ncbi:hypothetical protein O6H91_Y024500 [Diphasiastrum complanatum]|nr:hypothetical protein O6H91_Y024500 [Diphasiastrum complanatum]
MSVGDSPNLFLANIRMSRATWCSCALLLSLLFFLSHAECVRARALKTRVSESAVSSSLKALNFDHSSSNPHGDHDKPVKKTIANFNSLPKGRTPNPGPNPTHNDAIIGSKKSTLLDAQYRLQIKDQKHSMSSMPRGANASSGTLGQNKIAVNELPKGHTPGSGPNPYHN